MCLVSSSLLDSLVHISKRWRERALRLKINASVFLQKKIKLRSTFFLVLIYDFVSHKQKNTKNKFCLEIMASDDDFELNINIG